MADGKVGRLPANVDTPMPSGAQPALAEEFAAHDWHHTFELPERRNAPERGREQVRG